MAWGLLGKEEEDLDLGSATTSIRNAIGKGSHLGSDGGLGGRRRGGE
jgi:hypothetical protein